MNELPIGMLCEVAGEEFDLDAEIIRRNHLEADLLIKKGVKVRKPVWNGLMAS